jgi:predicted transcriptional regulator
MTKGFVALLAFTIALLATVSPTTASQRPGTTLNSTQPSDLQTKVLQDAEGNVHVLWIVPALNASASGPGIWYSKYSPNGTDSISPTRITNSTTIQSADLAVDGEGNAVIIWADDISPKTPISSILYMLRFNSTQSETSQILIRRGVLVLWPSLALGYNDSIHMTWTEYNPTDSQAAVEYGSLTRSGGIQTVRLASYAHTDAFPPQANLVFDNVSQNLQVAWGESEKDGESGSTVSYAKLAANGTILTQLQIAKFAAPLREVTMTGMGGSDGAFVVWQTTGSNYSLYVSQISAQGELVYVKQLPYTYGQSRYLAVVDRGENLYVVWYEPSAVVSQNATASAPTSGTNMTYVRMSVTGTIDESGTGVFSDPIIGVAVLSDGEVYGVSPDRLVSVVIPIQKQTSTFELGVIALMSCVSIAGFASSVAVEEGRYRWVTLYSRIRKTHNKTSGATNQETIKLLARRPGLRIRELKRSTDHSPSTMTLVALEKNGFVASFRDGLSRRFYVKDNEAGAADALRTRVLLWVLDHPGIWEAQVAKDLGLSQQIVHYHLKKLRETRLITAQVDANGTRKLYRFADSGSEAHD